jgi:hypothetical protein
MSRSAIPHDDASIKASRKKRERQLREDQRSEWDRFESLARSVLHVPKSEIQKKQRNS